jgi:tetratricopeptide (TPR) repeat protein
MRPVVCLLTTLSLALPAGADWIAGRQALDAHDCMLAVSEFREVVGECRDLPEGHYMLGLAYSQCQRHAEAEASLREAVVREPKPRYRLALAQALLDLDRPQEAYTTLEGLSLATVDPELKTQLALVLARAAQATDHSDEAVAVLRERTALSREGKLFYALGIIHDARSEHRAALECLLTAFELEPDNIAWGLAAARAAIIVAENAEKPARRLAAWSRAADIAARIAGSQPTFDHCLLAGETRLRAGGPSQALEWLFQAQRLRPHSALVLLRRAQCHSAMGELDVALAELRDALKTGLRGRIRREVYCELGTIYEARGEYRLAASAFKEANELDKARRVVARLERTESANADRDTGSQR